MTIVEMREKRAKLWNTMEGFLDTHRNEKGVLSVEDDATYATMEQDLNDLSNEIRRMERRDAIEAELSKPVNEPIKAVPDKREPEKQGRASNAYREDFGRHLRGKNPIHNVLSESPDQDGGYLVPEEFENQIISGLDEANVIRSIAKVITTHNDRKIPIAVGHSAAIWTAENAAFTESNPTFGQKQIDAYKLTDLIRVSMELLQDAAFDLETYIANEFSRAFGIAEEQAFCVGNGTDRPTGIFTANGGEVGVTAAANNAITADELINLVYALKSPYRRNAKFLTNDATISAIRKLKDGNGVYLWQPSLQAGEPDKLLGYDLYTTPYAPMMAAGAYTVAFGDFQNYWIGDRAGRTVQRLNELYATNGQIGYVLYDCSASRPGIEGKTNEESREVQTETLTIKATPLPSGIIKAKTGNTTKDSAYTNWYNSVYMPSDISGKNVNLESLSIGSLTLDPEFSGDVTVYTATTSNATNTITATAVDSAATVEILVNDEAVESGSSVTWEEGENAVVITVTNAGSSKRYTVTVTKEE